MFERKVRMASTKLKELEEKKKLSEKNFRSEQAEIEKQVKDLKKVIHNKK